MQKRSDAIYARQSVDRVDSISIESQMEFCRYELKGGECKEYFDKGYSGKNVDRPRFQELMKDIENGLISKVIVYKLDRISRSILDFSNMMATFQKYNVEFVSSTEKFDTSTPMGRAMLNICIVFAQLERETIQKRVTDAYYSRSQKGFAMGGPPPYGFTTEPIMLHGIHTRRLVAKEPEAFIVLEMFDMYQKPNISYGDIVRHFLKRGITFYGDGLMRNTLSQILRNPADVRADKSIYEFFKSQGAVIAGDGGDDAFNGVNGCYLYQGRDIVPHKSNHIQGQILVPAPHEGVVPADVWLKCRIKLMHNMTIQSARKAKNTWLAGRIKCGECGYALRSLPNPYSKQYLRCTKRMDNGGCVGGGTLITEEVEAYVLKQMKRKFEDFRLGRGMMGIVNSPRLVMFEEELARVDSEIDALITNLTGASPLLMTYVNEKIAQLDDKRNAIMKEMHDPSTLISDENMQYIYDSLNDWKSLDINERREVVGKLISKVRATSKKIEIEWKI